MTARDVKTNVEGYQEMSDEAFARRFYSDRAELIALGVPLESQRDEFTGEELYTLRSEQYFLPPLELTDEELAALQTYLYALEGGSPTRSRSGSRSRTSRSAARASRRGRRRRRCASSASTRTTRSSSRDGSRSWRARSRSSGRFGSRTGRSPATRSASAPSTPLALLNDNGIWYFVGEDLDDGGRRKKFRVSRIRGEIRFATRRERDFRFPQDFDIDDYRGRTSWQLGEPDRRGADRGRSGHCVVGRARVRARREDRGRGLRHRVLDPRAARVVDPAPGRTGATRGARLPSAAGRRWAPKVREAHTAAPPELAAAVEAAIGRPARAAGGPDRAGALRRPAGTARVPPRRLRRPAAGDDPGRTTSSSASTSRPTSSRSTFAPEPRQLRRRVLHGLRRARRATPSGSTRSSTATRSARRRA